MTLKWRRIHPLRNSSGPGGVHQREAGASASETAQTDSRMRPSLLFRRCRAVRWVPLFFIVFPSGAETAPPAEPLLHDGFTQEREIQPGETQAYTVELQAGQCLRVTVQEKGVDVEVRLLDPQGNPAVGVDTPSFPPPQETEELAAVAEQTGFHRVLIVAPKKQSPGRYLLQIDGPRAPEPADRARAEAVKI